MPRIEKTEEDTEIDLYPPKDWTDTELAKLDTELEPYKEDFISARDGVTKCRGMLLKGMTKFLKDKGALTKYSTTDTGGWTVIFRHKEKKVWRKGELITIYPKTAPDIYSDLMAGMSKLGNKGSRDKVADLQSLERSLVGSLPGNGWDGF